MFGALNRFISRLDAEPQEQKSALHDALGFQVLKNTNTELSLEPWFDFIIGINGRTIDNPDPNLFMTEVRNCAGTSISLGVFSAKGQRIREIYVPVPQEEPSLGLSLQWAPLSEAENVWHILDVIPNSPADVAGLLPYGDYVIGSPEGLVRGESGLGELVEDFLQRPMRLTVYNHEYNVTRPITITPSRNWGGNGALGCVLGFGALHRIPPPLDEPPQAPGETLFDTVTSGISAHDASLDEKQPLGNYQTAGAGGGDFLVPANMNVQAAARSPSPGSETNSTKPARKARAHHTFAAGGDMDDYFKEGEEKSKELDYGSSNKTNSTVKPPPKMGGPPRG